MDRNWVEYLMQEALKQADLAAQMGEVPVGAVVAIGDSIVARAHNLVEQEKDASMHAELLALKAASTNSNSWRLNEAVLCVTLEPCTMCIGAAKLARVGTLIFGAGDPEKGACGSLFDLTGDARLGPNPTVISGIAADVCVKKLQDFFRSRRK